MASNEYYADGNKVIRPRDAWTAEQVMTCCDEATADLVALFLTQVANISRATATLLLENNVISEAARAFENEADKLAVQTFRDAAQAAAERRHTEGE